MNDDDILVWARSLGLDLAVEGFPEDVIAAARDALARRASIVGLLEPTDEPWPANHVPI